MPTVTLATSGPEAAAVEAVEQHHAELAGALAALVDTLTTAAAQHDAPAADRARQRLARWCQEELLPHAAAEEDALYPAAHVRDDARLLVTAMLAEHEVIQELVGRLDTAGDPVRAAADARALRTLFESHLAKENELLLPVLAAAPDVSLAELLAGMHELLGEGDQPADGEDDQHAGSGGCGCGHADDAGLPELDARSVPHAIRHATIFGALDAVAPGGGLILTAPHDPLPLLAQLEQRAPGGFEVSYLERGPEAWRLQLLRR